MLKKYIPVILFIFATASSVAQDKRFINPVETTKIDSLKQQLARATSDSARMFVMEGIGFNYEVLDIDSSLKYTQDALTISRKHDDVRSEARIMATLSSELRQQGKFAEALKLLFKSLKIALDNNYAYDIARAYRRLGITYADLENFPKAVAYLLLAVDIDNKNANSKSAAIDHVFAADAYDKMNKLDSAAFHTDSAFQVKEAFGLIGPDIYNINGSIQTKKGNYRQALLLYQEAMKLAEKNNDLVVSSKISAGIADVFIKTNKSDSAIFYALKGFESAKKASFKKGIIQTGNLLSELYGSAQPAEALTYFKITAATKDSLFGLNNIQSIQDLVAREENRQKELESARLSYRNKLKLYGLLAGILALLVIAFILYGNNRHKQKANVLLQQQKEKVEVTLTELKSTQAQLIQSEKMASLGELTAGIAHEIQNPLNFVNNFSDVNKEMLEELKAERLKPVTERDEQIEADILNDILANEEKINHHGRRADAIVKGMLQHSQTSVGQKEPTDINALADEYLRLVYHGLRGKNKEFNVTMKTDFDQSLGPVNVIPQDLSRVLLNLYNNAFYAVNEKKRGSAADYEPTVFVSTKRAGANVVISVRDNGNGIPQKVLDKIFQPFFTTKPTGKGTGLGLSLSYDIVKAHGGRIEVESKENESSEFMVVLAG